MISAQSTQGRTVGVIGLVIDGGRKRLGSEPDTWGARPYVVLSSEANSDLVMEGVAASMVPKSRA